MQCIPNNIMSHFAFLEQQNLGTSVQKALAFGRLRPRVPTGDFRLQIPLPLCKS